ncbi:putative cytosolic protein [Granulibacter bethesdensis]|uniref:Cytosolic protein n=2 Tax=Granulibacter bethesdensis TaxID=364410 RepID=Q0BQ28_GRABC|nr:putative cytosolic protein [Granulibacter bethesdensis CGDNIH1]AHJ67958.1 putative cytosolic protein [Granulibacter bethesdensis]APH52949.1 putative cytosolic protein [Granulibacter bethesdensis]APH65637.1 putative cytosolic protein [Granulibacter bethesdensis]
MPSHSECDAFPLAPLASISEFFPMLTRETLTPQEALVCTMVLVAAADGGITDREIGTMAGLVQFLPVFQGFTAQELASASDATVNLLRDENGLAHASRLIRNALPNRLRETAYALACEVIAASSEAQQPSLRMLEMVAHELHLDPLVITAIERCTRARHQRV